MAHEYSGRLAAALPKSQAWNPLAWGVECMLLAELFAKKLINGFSQPVIALGHCITGIVALQPDLYFMLNVTPPGMMVMLLGQ